MRRSSRTRARDAHTSCSRRWPAWAYPTSSSSRKETPRRRSRSRTARCSSIRRRPSSHRPAASRSSSRQTMPTSSWSAPARLDWGPRCTGPRRASVRPCSTAAASAGQAGSSSLIRNYLGFPRGLGGARARPARLPAGVGLRHAFAGRARVVALEPASADSSCARPTAATEVSARAVVLALGVEYRRLERPGLRRPGGCRRLLRRVGVGGAGVCRRGRLRRRRRELGRAGRPPPRPLRAARRDPGSLTIPRRRACPST